jgi:hypothetical protein
LHNIAIAEFCSIILFHGFFMAQTSIKLLQTITMTAIDYESFPRSFEDVDIMFKLLKDQIVEFDQKIFQYFLNRLEVTFRELSSVRSVDIDGASVFVADFCKFSRIFLSYQMAFTFGLVLDKLFIPSFIVGNFLIDPKDCCFLPYFSRILEYTGNLGEDKVLGFTFTKVCSCWLNETLSFTMNTKDNDLVALSRRGTSRVSMFFAINIRIKQKTSIMNIIILLIGETFASEHSAKEEN